MKLINNAYKNSICPRKSSKIFLINHLLLNAVKIFFALSAPKFISKKFFSTSRF